MIIRIDAPHFCAGVVIKEPHNKCAPVVHYMKDWTVGRIMDYCFSKGWKAEIIRENRRPKRGTNHE